MTSPTPFVSMRLTGSRFGQTGMPVEVLPELAAYRELIIAVAREIFLTRNPGRQRVPRGFVESFQLRLERVDKGSAVPVLERLTTETMLFPELTDYFSDARDVVQGAILAVSSSGRLPDNFPSTALADFSRFGRTLRAGEFIELGSPNLARPARYSAAIRRILVRSKERNYLQESSIDGIIVEVNSDRSSFQLLVRTPYSSMITCFFERDLFEAVVSKLRAPGEEGEPVKVEGIISFDPQDRPNSIPFVTGIVATDDEYDPEFADDILTSDDSRRSLVQALARLAEIERLGDGWLDGEGNSVPSGILEYVRRLLMDIPSSALTGIRMYPTETGGVRLEWQRYSTEYSLDLNVDRTILYDELDLDTGSATERPLVFDEFGDVRVLLAGE